MNPFKDEFKLHTSFFLEALFSRFSSCFLSALTTFASKVPASNWRLDVDAEVKSERSEINALLSSSSCSTMCSIFFSLSWVSTDGPIRIIITTIISSAKQRRLHPPKSASGCTITFYLLFYLSLQSMHARHQKHIPPHHPHLLHSNFCSKYEIIYLSFSLKSFFSKYCNNTIKLISILTQLFLVFRVTQELMTAHLNRPLSELFLDEHPNWFVGFFQCENLTAPALIYIYRKVKLTKFGPANS